MNVGVELKFMQK